jgi:hypothetical protein
MDETCVEMRPLLGGLLDGELEPATARRLEAHLAACPDCRAALETMRAQDRMLRRVADAEDEKADPIAEERALAGVLQRIREEPEAEWERAAAVAEAARRPREAGRPRVWPSRLRWISGLAVATAAVLLALRLSPYPLAPEAPRSVTSKSTSGSETVVGGRSRWIARTSLPRGGAEGGGSGSRAGLPHSRDSGDDEAKAGVAAERGCAAGRPDRAADGARRGRRGGAERPPGRPRAEDHG